MRDEVASLTLRLQYRGSATGKCQRSLSVDIFGMTVIGKNYIFIHVPKSAGQSVTARLGGVTKSVPGHAPLFYIQPDIRAERLAFGFVRNPWDRLVSVYAFMCAKRIKKNESAAYQKTIRAMGFDRWLTEDALFVHQDALWRTPQLAPIQRRTQMFWLEGCDFIGSVENLEQDFRRVAELLVLKPGWKEKLGFGRAIPHRNRSSRDDYRTYYSDDTAAFVAKHFEPEIKRFDYHF